MNAFLDAFATEAGLRDSEADEQWAGFSRQLSDNERARIERGGTRSGQRQGREFLQLYPQADHAAA